MTQDPIRQYIDTHIPENHPQGDGCWDAAERAMGMWPADIQLDVMTTPEPLTAEELAQVRHIVEMGGYLTASKWGKRLLATLDARAPLDQATAVYEALAGLKGSSRADLIHRIELLQTDLQAERAARAPLDVERLAEAISAAGHRDEWGPWVELQTNSDQLAETIAAEYAANPAPAGLDVDKVLSLVRRYGQERNPGRKLALYAQIDDMVRPFARLSEGTERE